jgi:hypothetical protein
MDVTIQESRFALRSAYAISSPTTAFTATRKFWSLLAHITVAAADGSIAATIRGTSFFRARYVFEIANGPTYTFNRTSVLKSIYTCEGNGRRFDYFEHRGMRSSIFQDDRQIASLSKNRLVIGTGNKFSIQMNSDADLLLITCMVLAVNTTRSKNEKQGGVNIDMGNLGMQGRPCDETWLPH